MNKDILKIKELSYRIGKDLSLIQASGGNTSIKVEEVMWVKASGKQLKNAFNENIFVAVDFNKIRKQLAINKSNRDIKFSNICGANLRPSIETSLHAVMPNKVVIHTHAVDVIAITLLNDSLDYLKKSLKGINWKFIPYYKPGIPLANAIIKELRTDPPNVLILGNHGLVVGEETIEKAEELHSEIISRLRTKTRIQEIPNIHKLNLIVDKIPNSRLPKYPIIHSLATDQTSFKRAQNNSPFPDHLVFCGRKPLILNESYDIKQNIYGLVEGVGVVLFDCSTIATEEMLMAQAEVFLRIPAKKNINFLSDKNCDEILNLESEKYRKDLFLK